MKSGWEKKEGKYTKTLAKIQVTAIFLKVAENSFQYFSRLRV